MFLVNTVLPVTGGSGLVHEDSTNGRPGRHFNGNRHNDSKVSQQPGVKEAPANSFPAQEDSTQKRLERSAVYPSKFRIFMLSC